MARVYQLPINFLLRMKIGILGMFSDTLLKWREPSGGFDFAFLKKSGIMRVRGRFPAWIAYKDIDYCSVTFDAKFIALNFAPKKKKAFYLVEPVAKVLVPEDKTLHIALIILQRKNVKISSLTEGDN